MTPAEATALQDALDRLVARENGGDEDEGDDGFEAFERTPEDQAAYDELVNKPSAAERIIAEYKAEQEAKASAAPEPPQKRVLWSRK